MSFTIVFTEKYEKRAMQFLKIHPDLLERYDKTLRLLHENPYHPSLRLHPLKGRLKSLHSVSITMSYRISLELIISDHEIVLINIGDHDDVY